MHLGDLERIVTAEALLLARLGGAVALDGGPGGAGAAGGADDAPGGATGGDGGPDVGA